jgi:hypothetical protein
VGLLPTSLGQLGQGLVDNQPQLVSSNQGNLNYPGHVPAYEHLCRTTEERSRNAEDLGA